MKKVIIQETDETILEVINVALCMEGFDVIPIHTCDESILPLIEEQKPHVVMLEFFLDGVSCIEICELIKNKYPRLPVVALSCNYHINEVYDKYGFDDFIRKPFDLKVLYKVVRKHTEEAGWDTSLEPA